jgi:hypothetical protein
MGFGLQRFPDRQVGSNAEPLSLQMVRYGAPIDFTGATVTFRAVDALTGLVKINGAGQGADNGIVQYMPSPTDVDTPGEYACQFIATFADQSVQRSELIFLRVLPNG